VTGAGSHNPGNRPEGDESVSQDETETGKRLEAGERVRRTVLGDDHVDAAKAATTEFDADFQRYITESAWGAVWGRGGLTRRERSLLTIALLGAFCHEEELAMHIRATADTGASEEDVKETLLHMAVYAGVPAANRAFKVAKRTFAEMKGEETH